MDCSLNELLADIPVVSSDQKLADFRYKISRNRNGYYPELIAIVEGCNFLGFAVYTDLINKSPARIFADLVSPTDYQIFDENGDLDSIYSTLEQGKPAVIIKNNHYRGTITPTSLIHCLRSKQDPVYSARGSDMESTAGPDLWQSLASTSHELRNSIYSLLNINSYLSSKLEESEKPMQDLLDSTGELILRSTEDLMDYASIARGNFKMRRIEFSPRNFAERIYKVFEAHARTKDNTVYLHLGELPEKLIGDTGRISQILSNLLQNAVRYTNRGNIHLYVARAEKSRTAEMVDLEFIVADSGIGIPEEDREVITTAYQRGSEAEKTAGYGLGLIITAQIIEALGGTMKFRSPAEKFPAPRSPGTEFYITLPFAVPE